MSLPERVRVNHPHVIHEIIDGEAILVNLENGSYYSSADVGAVIWDAIENEIPLTPLVEMIVQSYTGDAEEIRAQVRAHLDALLQERLVVPNETPPAAAPSLPTLPNHKPPFTAPKLQKYTEMEDLLLLDPIHDVDDSGWPQRPTESSAP